MVETRSSTEKRESMEKNSNGVSGEEAEDHTHWRYRVTRSVSEGNCVSPRKENGEKTPTSRDSWFVVIAALSVLVGITWFTKPERMSTNTPEVQHVWYYGWLSAVSTGLGTIPLLFWEKPSDIWMGISNSVAAGMMLSASYSLVTEGSNLEPDNLMLWGYQVLHLHRVIGGVIAGMLFVFLSKQYLEEYEDLNIGDVKGIEAAKILLIVGVMTLHSFAEGLGIGVSFCGSNGSHLGVFISASLAVHNVPEGLAVALVLIPRGMSKFRTFLWSICTSLPQPLIAAPVFLFVEHFVAWEPVGLGFAAGAMFWVACFELIADSIKDISLVTASTAMITSFIAMMCMSHIIDTLAPNGSSAQ